MPELDKFISEVQMKISVVTVAFNEEKNIAKTIESVLNQTTKDIEYIICDGKSTDKTAEIAESYNERFSLKGIEYVVNSEKDSGIYDAMNKGIEKATGEYICFLNAGDWFYNNEIVENVINKISASNKPDLLYGNVMFIERGVIFNFNGDENGLETAMTVPHPSVFASAEIMKRNKFDTKYKIAADYNFVLGQKLAGKSFCKLDEIITCFSGDGVSSKNVIKSIKEREAVKASYGLTANTFKTKINMYREQINVIKRNLLPTKLWQLWSVKVQKRSLYREKENF